MSTPSVRPPVPAGASVSDGSAAHPRGRERVVMRHPIRAVLLASAFVPAAYWVGLVLVEFGRGQSRGRAPGLDELAILFAFGMPVALAVALSWGLPMILWLRRRGWLSPWKLLAWGALGGGLVAVAVELVQRGSLLPVRLSPAAGAALGGLAGLVSWWAGGRRGGRAVSGPGAGKGAGRQLSSGHEAPR
jgi:hypothetical protein